MFTFFSLVDCRDSAARKTRNTAASTIHTSVGQLFINDAITLQYLSLLSLYVAVELVFMSERQELPDLVVSPASKHFQFHFFFIKLALCC